MSGTLELLYSLAMGLCLLGGAAGLILGLRAPKDHVPGRAARVGLAALALLLFTLWTMRWVHAGHLPIFGNYESAISLALAVVLVAVGYQLWAGFSTLIGPLATLMAGAILAHGSLFDVRVYALTISERSWVVTTHAVFAWGAFAMLTFNAASSLHLLRRRDPSPRARHLVARSLELGFVLHTGMLLSGSLYRFLLFGKAWNFDPIETMGLAAWLAYGALMHMVRFAGWREQRLARWCLFLFVLLIVSYRTIVYFPSTSTYHNLDISERMHLSG